MALEGSGALLDDRDVLLCGDHLRRGLLVKKVLPEVANRCSVGLWISRVVQCSSTWVRTYFDGIGDVVGFVGIAGRLPDALVVVGFQVWAAFRDAKNLRFVRLAAVSALRCSSFTHTSRAHSRRLLHADYVNTQAYIHVRPVGSHILCYAHMERVIHMVE